MNWRPRNPRGRRPRRLERRPDVEGTAEMTASSPGPEAGERAEGLFTVQVELLCGRYTAGAYNDRDSHERPPHPQRLFSALVATWADADAPAGDEHQVLEWLAGQGAPVVHCSQASQRQPVTFFVPVNDAAIGRDTSRHYEPLLTAVSALAEACSSGEEKVVARARRALETAWRSAETSSASASAPRATESAATIREALQLVPDLRGKQARSFPTVIPDNPVVWYCWPGARPSPDQVSCLDGLAGRLHRLGHSSTFVSCTVHEGLPSAADDVLRLEPCDDGPISLRVAGPGDLAEMESAYRRHLGREPRVIPAHHRSYKVSSGPAAPARTATSALSGGWLALSLQVWDEHRHRPVPGQYLPASRAVQVASAVRDALVGYSPDPACELIAGHAPGGDRNAPTAPSERDHLAVLALPYVGAPYADGMLRGIALATPVGTSGPELLTLQEALRSWAATGPSIAGWSGAYPLYLAGGLAVMLGRADDDDDVLVALQGRRWAGPARAWATVTPLALDRHPGSLGDRDPRRRAKAEGLAEATVRAACARIGLAEPAEVALSRQGFVRGVLPVAAFPAFTSNTDGGPP